MKPISLRLYGFSGIRSGMGKDEFTLDLQALSGRLIAISGPNGRGKSTLIDNLHPYRVMPSRSGSYRPDGFSYWDHLTGAFAEKELVWEHSGVTFKTHLVFKNSGKTKAAEAYLYEQKNGAWQPAALPDGTISDGKTTSYDLVLEGIVGSPETFFTSAFAAQNRRQIQQLTAGEIKNLLGQMLGLDNILGLGEKARTVGNLLVAKQSTLRTALTSVFEAQAALPTLQSEYAALRQKQGTLDRQVAMRAVAAAHAEVAKLQAIRDATTATENRRANLVNEIAGVAQERQKAEITYVADCAAIDKKASEEIARTNTLISQRQSVLAEITGQVTQQRAILARQDAIIAAQKSLDEAKAAAVTIAATLTSAQEKQSRASTLKAELAQHAVEQRGLKEQGTSLAAQAESLKQRASLMAKVPCGTVLQNCCPLLVDAVQAAKKLPVLETDLATKRSAYGAANTKTAALTTELAKLGNIESEMKAAQAAERANSVLQQQLAELAAQAPLLASAESAIARYAAQTAALQSEIGAMTQQMVQSSQEQQAAKQVIDNRHAQIMLGLAQRETACNAEIAQLPPAFDITKLQSAQSALTNANELLASIDRQIAEVTGQVAAVESKIALITKTIADAQVQRGQLEAIDAEIAQWALLAKAMSRDGVVALSIDDVGPTIATLANRLLRNAFSSRYSLSIITQAQTQKGTQRETFDVLVHDAETATSKPLAVMSGGERVWLNESLTRAVALYLAQTDGSQYATLFSDESDGPLDSVKKMEFMRMKRAVLELGGYEREYFITQTPELLELADDVIDLTVL